jgi:membrane protein DedA with SNARE-associated domain
LQERIIRIHEIYLLFERYALQIPLELFVFAGTFIEELISPIPSVAIMLPAGAAASVQSRGVWFLLLLSILSAGGRIIAGLTLYWLANKIEAKTLANGRRFMGVSHRQVAHLRQRLSRTTYGAWIALFFMNALPVFPAGALSICCGFVRMPLGIFMTATIFGSTVSAFCYLLAGYGGLKAATAVQSVELLTQLIAAILAVGLVGWWLIYKRHKRRALRLP